MINNPKNVDETFFKELVAKAILFRQTTQLIKAQKFGGYENHIVAYTVALLCELGRSENKQIDFQSIWRNQSISNALSEAVVELAKTVQAATADVESGKNVYEWFKRATTWDSIKSKPAILSTQLKQELKPL